MDRARHVADIVGRAVAAEVARVGAGGVIIADPMGDVRDLLRRWLEPFVPVALPDDRAVAALVEALEVTQADESARTTLALRAWAGARGSVAGLLPVAGHHRTTLLLDPGPLASRVLPLGDLSVTELSAFGCVAPLPPVLRGRPAEEVAAVEGALDAYLQDGASPERAFAALGDVGGLVRTALDLAEGRRRGLLVPKLRSWTVGRDLER